ncbi:DegT/DnrJ/EryC1/StrS family aminotransferase [Mogibacterium pumilum]|uniref:Capsular biosynthesis protein n=1 Tax=Mogibacterium pumilum TaxID=86332 RepID=A0A223AQZ0_9FIRM|nr:DegT/DnrJ/EryC1/StrS family aminotransferase [Mogibacterium pumilum]ASS37339.1 capsular biosynthesis protein [Mogibacterium pumilum]
MKVPFSPPDISELEINRVVEILKSGWITTGPEVKEFERRIAEYIGVDKAVALSSATASLEAALHILGVGEEDEVIVPAYTYTASASPVVHKGAKLVIIDSAPETFEMDYDKVAEAINDNTKAVIPVDLGGMVCDYDRLFEIVEAKKDIFKPANKLQEALGRVAVISDGAHAFGSIKKGIKAGAIADFTSFSFHAVKNLTTAEGGALSWKTIEGIDNDELYHELQLYSLHGQSKDALSKNKAGAWEYDVVYPAYKCNMTNINAAIGIAQLERYDGLLARRRELNQRYEAALEKHGIKVMHHYTDEMTSTGHLYLVRIPGASVEDRNAVIQDMAEREIACNVHYKPLPMMTAYKNLGFDIADYPNAYHQYENLISLPIFSTMTDEQNEYVIENFVDILKKRGLIK